MDYFWPKYMMFELENYKGIMFDGTHDWYRVWGKTNLTWGIWQFFNRALSLKIRTLMTSFYLKSKIYELKIYRGVIFHDNKEWCKVSRAINLSVQNWHEGFDELWRKLMKISRICTLMDCIWPKHIMFKRKKVQGNYVWWQWILMQKTVLHFQKLHERFSKCSREHVRKSKNWDFDGILLSKVENVWA